MTSAPALTLTGERTLPGIAHENYWFRRHEAAYLALPGLVPDTAVTAGAVLEAGAGEGYGAALLAEAGARVVALDYDPTAVAHLARRYPRVAAVRGNVVATPFTTAAFDAVVSLQVVEHLWDQRGYVAECARLLRPGGRFAVSTPNRLTFSPGYDPVRDRPCNAYHTREFAADELAELLAPWFRLDRLVGLHAGARVRELDEWSRRRYGHDLVGAQLDVPAEEWPAELRAAVASVTATDFDVSARALDRSLDLIAVGTRR